MEVQDVKEQLKSIFRQVINNNKVDNWNEQDHPRDEQGKFTDKGGGSNTYKTSLLKEYKAVKENIRKEIVEKSERINKILKMAKDNPQEAKFHIKLAEDIMDEIQGLEEQYKYTIEQLQEVLKINNNKETDMALLDELKKLINKVENTKGEKDMEIDNEKVDKRDIIRQIMAIAGKEEASEDVKTIAKLAEKLAYDKSEAGTADNEKAEDKKECDNKKEVKNEDEKDKKEVKEIKEDVKEDVENKCKNSVDNAKEDYFEKMRKIYNSAIEPSKEEKEYTSRADRLKAAEEYFKV